MPSWKAQARMWSGSRQSKWETAPWEATMASSPPSGRAVIMRWCRGASGRVCQRWRKTKRRSSGENWRWLKRCTAPSKPGPRSMAATWARGEDQAVLAGLDVEPPDAVVLRLRHVPPGVGHPGVTVAGALMLQAREAQGHRLAAVAAQGVDRPRQGAHHRPGLRLAHHCHEAWGVPRDVLPAALAGPLGLLAGIQAVVVDDPGGRRRRAAVGHVSAGVGRRQPVEHGTLLPAPGAGPAEGAELAALEVDDAHGGAVGRGGRPRQELRLEAE